jgi:hypothetical protein
LHYAGFFVKRTFRRALDGSPRRRCIALLAFPDIDIP